MPEIYDYLNHPFISELHQAVSAIIQLLDRHNHNAKSLYVAQECLFDEIIALEQAARDLKTKAQATRQRAAELAKQSKRQHGQVQKSVKTRTKAMYKQALEYDEGRRLLQYGRWLLRYVGDGIAWHAFGHNRRIIRALASKEPVPAITDLEGVLNVRRIFRAVRQLDRDRLPVLHDLTNCLRTADISIFRDGHLERIMELKIRRGDPAKKREQPNEASQDDRSRRQEERQKRIVSFLQSKDLGDLDPRLAGGQSLDSETLERHNFEAVSQAIARAREQGFGISSPDPGVLYVAWGVYQTDVDTALSEAVTSFPEIFHSLITFRSISGRFEEHEASMPITAMDLPADDILDILFGRIGIVAIVNFAMLEEACSKLGVHLETVQLEGGGFSVRVKAKNLVGEVIDGLWDRLMLEALSVETFAGLISTIIENYPDNTN